MVNNVQHLFKCLVAICMSFYWKNVYSDLPIFKFFLVEFTLKPARYIIFFVARFLN